MRLLHFADLHLGVEAYGHIDPATGLSSRLQDFLAALDRAVDYALNNAIHLVLFCGDAYKSREPSPTQQREFAKRIGRLASAGIPVFLLVGNHDQPQALGRATAIDIFDTLAVQNTIVASRPQVYRLATRAGLIQVAALPWLRRSAFLAREEARSLSLEEVNHRLRQKLDEILQHLLGQLEPGIPAVLAAHVWVDTAKPSGTERMLAVGGEPQIALSSLAHPALRQAQDTALSYVALGHIHRHQAFGRQPPVVYSGSLERQDFREEGEEKGFVVVEIEGREARWQFLPVPARRFLTLELKVDAQDSDPTATVLQALARQQEAIKGAIVRLNISLPPEVEGLLREGELRRALSEAFYMAAITREVKREPRVRLGGVEVERLAPLEALAAYLHQRQIEGPRAQQLLEYGKRLVAEVSGEEAL